MIRTSRLTRISTRNISKYLNKDRTSKEIRKRFLDYFINENEHAFVRSSPVAPYCDSTLAFVNAGMNQFKNIFTGKQTPKFKRVANSQKCIRAGGKHNDLSVVGTDGYHHTFFEMLGNWSFGDYFKTEACTMAWKLLTDVYKLPASRLYVTYFKGCDIINVAEDLETKEIWKSLGIPESRILPFGVECNFWEMGPVGPCGPCTEIHIDHIGGTNRAAFVNKGLFDLTELWNIVFIQYNRIPDGTLIALPQKHVDTGLGFERLTSVLQGKTSNYDTDNFTYLLNAIHKICSDVPAYEGNFGEKDWNSLDSAYRIMSDHARTVTVCLADGMIPEQNQKLRRIMRKVFLLSENTFKKEQGLLKELSNYVVEVLGSVYTEMERNISQIHQIIDYEEEIYKQLRKSACEEWSKLVSGNKELLALDILESPSLIGAYKEIVKNKPKSIDGELAFKFYDTFGLDEETIVRFAKALNLGIDRTGFGQLLDETKSKSRNCDASLEDNVIEELEKSSTVKTDDSFKYTYNKNDKKTYEFRDLEVRLLKIVQDDKVIQEIGRDSYCSLILDKTNLYSEAGGQVSDKGTITFKNNLFQVTEAENRNGYILHKGFLKCNQNFKLKPNATGVLSIHPSHRLNAMRNHTGTHLLNGVLKKIKGATCQKSSKVTDLYLNLDVGIFGDKLNVEEIHRIESCVKGLIEGNLEVRVRYVDGQEFLSYDDLTVIPGEVYPETNIRIVEVVDKNGFVSREPCCGTHVLNTADIEDFCVIGFKSLGRSTMSLHAVTGERAKTARKNGEDTFDEIMTLQKNVNDNIDKPEVLEMAIAALKHRLNFGPESGSILPVLAKHNCLEQLNSISKQIKDTAKGNFKEFIDMEMQNVLESHVLRTRRNQRYVVHYLRSSMLLQSVPLQRATRLCPDIPVLIISYSDNVVKARCCVPKGLVNETFDAEKWLGRSAAAVFKSPAQAPRGQEASLVCNMKAKKVNLQEWDTLLNETLETARRYIEEHL